MIACERLQHNCRVLEVIMLLRVPAVDSRCSGVGVSSRGECVVLQVSSGQAVRDEVAV